MLCPLIAPKLVFDIKIKKNKKFGFLNSAIEKIQVAENNEYINENIEINRNLKNRVSLSDITSEHENNYSYFRKVFLFMQSPIVKFAYHKIAFLLFLTFFSYYVLCDYPEEGNDSIKWTEILLILWVFSYFIEAVHQVYIQDTKLYYTKLKFFVQDYWNIFDLIAILIFTVGIILRFIPKCDNCFKAGE